MAFLFAKTDEDIQLILSRSDATNPHIAKLQDRREVFSNFLEEELKSLFDDAVEIAFIRAVPEVVCPYRDAADSGNEPCEDCDSLVCKCDNDDEECYTCGYVDCVCAN